MVYVALLRGINVGGKAKVEMPRLKAMFEKLGLMGVKTYINTGNVIFESDMERSKLVEQIERAISTTFKLDIKVVVRSLGEIKVVINELPKTWVNDQTMKCDVMFLWEDVDSPAILKQMPEKKDFEDIKYLSGAVLWRIDRPNLTKSRILKLAGTQLYKHMTIRNCNTVRKLYELMQT